MSTRTEKFQKKPLDPQDTKKEEPKEPEEIVKFSPEEEAVKRPHNPAKIRY